MMIWTAFSISQMFDGLGDGASLRLRLSRDRVQYRGQSELTPALAMFHATQNCRHLPENCSHVRASLGIEHGSLQSQRLSCV